MIDRVILPRIGIIVNESFFILISVMRPSYNSFHLFNIHLVNKALEVSIKQKIYKYRIKSYS